MNEKEANAFLHPYGYKALREDGIRFLDGSIPQPSEKVNEKFSISGTEGILSEFEEQAAELETIDRLD